MKKFLSLLLATVMMAGMMILPASAVYTYPESCIIINETYEAYSDGNQYAPQKDGHHFSGGRQYLSEIDGNMVWNMNHPSNPGSSYVNLSLELNACTDVGTGGIAQVNTGTAIIEYDMYYPTPAAGKQLASGQSVGHYISMYSSAWQSSAPNKNMSYLTYSKLMPNANGSGHYAQIWFPVTYISYPHTVPDENTDVIVDLSMDIWYHITHVIDYDKGEIHHYVNDECVATSTQGIVQNAPLYQTYFYTCTTNGVSADFTEYLDNVRISRVSNDDPLELTIDTVGDTYLDLSVSRTADLSGLSAADFSLKEFNGATIGAPTSAHINGNHIRLTYPAFVKDKSYELYVNKAITAMLNPAQAIPAGTKLAFVTGIPSVSKVLIDEDFEDWSTLASPEVDFADAYDTYMEGESATNPSVYGDYTGWKYTAASESEYISAMAHNGSTMMKIDHGKAMSLAETGQEFLIPFGKTVSSGVMEISFDVIKNSPALTQLAFGLHDTAYQAEGASYQPVVGRSVSTLLGGYSYYDTKKSSIVANYEEFRNAIPDCYCHPDNELNVPNEYETYVNGKKKTYHTLKSTATLKGRYTEVTTLASNVVHTWKFVVDFDNQTYTAFLYEPGSTTPIQKTMAYIPGGSVGNYDAFAINAMTVSADGTAIAANADSFTLIDNLKVSHTGAAPMLNGATFVKYDGREYGHNGIMSAGTKSIELEFSAPINASTLSHITIPGAYFTCRAEGEKVIIDLPRYLVPGTTYTLTVGKCLTDNDNNELGTDVVIEFTTDAGEQHIEMPTLHSGDRQITAASKITLGQSLIAKAQIVNTAGATMSGYLVVASYKNGMLAGAYTAEQAPVAHSFDLVADFVADEGFADSDEIKIFLFNSKEAVQPLLSPTVIPSGREWEFSVMDTRYFRLLGRGEIQGNARTFNWPNAGLEFLHEGNTASVYVEEATYDVSIYYGSYFTLAVYDGDTLVRTDRVKLQEGWNTFYERAEGDPAVATLRLVRSSEADCGALSMSTIKVDNIPRPTQPKERLIEFIGDSYTVGYANSPHLATAVDYRCSLNSDNWNCYTGFVARHFGADHNVLAYSGRGISVNGDGSAAANMQLQITLSDPYINQYPDINLSTQAKHDFSDYQPDLVTIWLGDNDMCGGATEDVVREGFENMISTLRTAYPDAKILAINMETEDFADVICQVMEKEGRGEANGYYTMSLKSFTSTSQGHPDVAEDQRIANQIIAKIESIPGVWE